MNRFVEVAVIGAGHAGLNAIKEIRKLTDDYVLINGGALGTTCARIGCMPSKVAIHLAETYQKRTAFDRYGISGASDLQIDQTEALEHVRELRDTFVDLVLANTTDEMDQEHLIEDYAEFTGPNTLRVGDDVMTADAVIIATGARSVIPEAWRDYADGILTVDTLFEQESLPESIAVIGLGPIGIEIGQALHRMGVRVVGIEKGETISGLADAGISQAACSILEREFPLWLGQAPDIHRDGDRFLVRAGEREARVDKLFLALGRTPNLDRLGLDRLQVRCDSKGVPRHNPAILKLDGLPVYLAGDAAGGIANLQRAAEQGRVAGYNAVHRKPIPFREKTPMKIIFTDPNIAVVGREWSELDPGRTAVAQRRFGPVGRAMIMGQNRGLIRVYADRKNRKILGAAMVGTRAEHLAHLLSWAIESGMTVERALGMPFYHPVIEEALQEVLHELDKELSSGREKTRYVFFRKAWNLSGA